MSIQSTVEAQITAANAWATEARNDAQSALQELADIDVPTVILGAIPFTPLTTYTPDVAPQPSLTSELGDAPEILDLADVTMPTAPTIPTVSLGELLSLTIPDAPTVTLPTLDLEPPTYSITAPSTWSLSVANIVISEDPMVQAAMARLADNIANGGTGLSPAVEAGIWDRDLERNEQALADAVDKVAQVWAKKNWSLPDGFLSNAISDIQKEYMNRRIDRSREIAVEQGKLEQSNLFKSIELGVNLVARLIDLLVRHAELVLKADEATAKFANEYIDLQIRTYAALLEAYKIKAAVYETMVRASMTEVEIFRGQIEAQKLIGEVNRQTVEIYSERLKAHTVLVEQFKAEVEGAVALLNAERVKIEANKLRMDAWAKKADIGIAEFSGQVDLFRSVSQQNISTADLAGRQAEATLRANLAATELSLKAAEQSNRSLQTAASLKIEAAKGVAQAASTLAAGAMAGVTTGADMRYNESRPLTQGS